MFFRGGSMKVPFVFVLAVLCTLHTAPFGFGQSQRAPTPLLSFGVTPSFSIPVGRDTQLFTYGGGANVDAEYRLPFLPLVYVGGTAGFSYVPLKAVSSISLAYGGVSAGIHLDLFEGLAVHAGGTCGYFYGFLNDGSGNGGGNPVFTAGADLRWTFVPALSLGAGARYRVFAGLSSDVAATLGITYNVSASETKPAPTRTQPPARPQPLDEPANTSTNHLEIRDVTLGSVFPVLHAWYDTNALGRLVVANTGTTPITDVQAVLLVRQFMDASKECGTIAVLKPGEQAEIPLYALFKNTVFETKESTKVPAEITLSYCEDGQLKNATKVETLRLYDRNAMRWDDTNKAAAFVMPKEPAVLSLSNQVVAAIRDARNSALDENLQNAIALHDALRLMGISYAAPPLTSYAALSQDRTSIDSVKFPLETIQYRSGDCSDLSVLYCSLLESLQIETAFVTIPSHIFVAFALNASEEDVRNTFTSTDEFIFRDGRAWVPLEVTERSRTLLAAWQEGAREWREYSAQGTAEFYPVRRAWQTYEPVNFPGSGAAPAAPDGTQVVRDFKADISGLIEHELAGREAEKAAAVKESGGSPRTLNSLGLLYARFGQSDRAEVQFLAALKKIEYLPALVNLGNIRFLKGDMDQALACYQRAFAVEPHNPAVLLALARTNHQLQNYGLVEREYGELRTLRPDLARQYDYLQLKGGGSTRAAESAGQRGRVVWEEEK